MYILTHTIVNPKLSEQEQFVKLHQQKPEALIEWAARLCYNSQGKFGTHSEFIPGLIKSGHMDVLEHVSLSAKIKFHDLEPEARYYWYYITKNQYPYLDIKIRDNSAIMSTNMRVWQEMYWRDFAALDAFSVEDKIQFWYYLNYICPHVIGKPKEYQFEISRMGGEHEIERQCAATYNKVRNTIKNFAKNHVMLTTDAEADVTLLGYSGFFKEDNIFYATVQYDGVSRAFMAQHTRHRLLSHSVTSQRYVDQSNSYPVITGKVDLATRHIIEDDYRRTMKLYESLREKNKKEDARMILPNCTNTSMVSSSNHAGWLHYLKLRTAKDAQHEIRQCALATETLLNQIIGGVHE